MSRTPAELMPDVFAVAAALGNLAAEHPDCRIIDIAIDDDGGTSFLLRESSFLEMFSLKDYEETIQGNVRFLVADKYGVRFDTNERISRRPPVAEAACDVEAEK